MGLKWVSHYKVGLQRLSMEWKHIEKVDGATVSKEGHADNLLVSLKKIRLWIVLPIVSLFDKIFRMTLIYL